MGRGGSVGKLLELAVVAVDDAALIIGGDDGGCFCLHVLCG
jgi:hypothetical protein